METIYGHLLKTLEKLLLFLIDHLLGSLKRKKEKNQKLRTVNWTVSFVTVQQPSSIVLRVWHYNCVLVLWCSLSIAVFAFPTNTLLLATHWTWQYFDFFDIQLYIIARMECIPFTVFTKTCFSLLGSFSSSSTPWKMRPNVPVKDKPHVFIWGKGQERHSQRHHIQSSKCHLTHRPSCLADLWTEVDRPLLKMLCLLMVWGSFGSCLTDKGQNKRDSLELRGPFIT